MNKKIIIGIVILAILAIAGFFVFGAASKPSAPPNGLSMVVSGVVTEPLPANNAEPTSSKIGGEKEFIMAEVQAHNTRESCYTVVRGNVYDVTQWIDQHPGGPMRIIAMCGVDATDAFVAQHGGQARPEHELASFKIGVLKQ